MVDMDLKAPLFQILLLEFKWACYGDKCIGQK